MNQLGDWTRARFFPAVCSRVFCVFRGQSIAEFRLMVWRLIPEVVAAEATDESEIEDCSPLPSVK
jgi:hypothetical protein